MMNYRPLLSRELKQDPIGEYGEAILYEWACEHGHAVNSGVCACGARVITDAMIRSHWLEMRGATERH